MGPTAPRVESRLGVAAIALILLYGGSLLLALAASGKTLSYHEARYAQSAREMVASGQWLVPTVGGDPRLQKPPFTYWSIAAAIAAFGSEGEWPVRLPSVLASLATAVLVAALAAWRLGRNAGLLAGLVQTTSVYVFVSGQLADPDMLLAAAVSTAMAAFAAIAVADGPDVPSRRALSLAFFAAIGIAFLIKGPIGPAFVLSSCLAFVILGRRRAAWRRLLDPYGIAVFTILVVAWPIAAYLSQPRILDAWLEENVSRFQGGLGRHSPLFYLYTAPWMILPWTPFTALGVASVWREKDRDPLWALLAAWFLCGLALLSASAGKHDRYLAPILPPLAMFTARGLTEAVPFVRRRARPVVAFGAALAAVWVVTVAVQLIAAQWFDGYRYNRQLAERVNRRLPADATLVLAEIPHNERIQLLYYLAGSPRRVDAAAFVANPPESAHVLGPATVRSSLARVGQAEVLDQAERPLKHHGEEQRLTLMQFRRGVPP